MHSARIARTTTVLLALATALTLAGCTASIDDPPGTPQPAPSSPTASANPAAALNCDLLLPVELAASGLGLPASTLVDPATVEASDQPAYSGATLAAMDAAALTRGGLLSCGFSAPDNGTGVQADDGSHRLPSATVAALPNSAAEFALVEPDVDDGLNGFAPADLGDAAFVACHPPSADSCRAEILVGTTWLSATITPRPTDEAFTAFASAVVAAAQTADAVPPVSAPDKVGCDALLSSQDLADTLGIPNAQPEDYLALTSRNGGIRPVAQVMAGLIKCGWVSADAGAAMNGVNVSVLPGGKAAWDLQMPSDLNSNIPFEPLSGIGDSAFAGCSADTCEVDVLAGDVWLSVSNYVPTGANLDGTKTLAQTVLANYLAASGVQG